MNVLCLTTFIFPPDYWLHYTSLLGINLYPDRVCVELTVQLRTHISSLLPCCASFPAVQICPISHGLTGWNSVWNGAATIQTLNNKENFTDKPIFCSSPAGQQRWRGDAKRAYSTITSPSKCSVYRHCRDTLQKHRVHLSLAHKF